MSMTPARFERDLNSRLGLGYDLSYRLRESPDGQSFLIEQRIGRGSVETPFGEGDERHARARDGYGLVARTLKYPYFRCKECHLTMRAPEMRFAEIHCAYCKAKGEKSYYIVGYFPLCDRLIEHLEQTHPKRGTAWQREHAEANRLDLKATDRKADNALDSVLRDDFRRLVRTPRTYLADHRPY